MTGHYALTTSYTGSVEIDVPSSVGFLDPIEMASPQLDKAVPLDKSIMFHWKNIPQRWLPCEHLRHAGPKTVVIRGAVPRSSPRWAPITTTCRWRRSRTT